MIKRPLWFSLGAAAGAGGALWAQRRLLRRVRRARRALGFQQGAGLAHEARGRLRAARVAASSERARREGELWASLGPPAAAPGGLRPVPGGIRREAEQRSVVPVRDARPARRAASR